MGNLKILTTKLILDQKFESKQQMNLFTVKKAKNSKENRPGIKRNGCPTMLKDDYSYGLFTIFECG